VLTWVVYASRSLTVEDLRHAVASSPDTLIFDKCRLATIELIVGVCCGLLTVEEETGIVRLIRKPLLLSPPTAY
jgi:ankyrin repeat domain-containing protein 50